MSGLQGSRWASKAPAKDSKDNTEEKHPSVPSFGFQLPAIPRVTTAPAPTPQKHVPGPPGAPAGLRSSQPSTMPKPTAANIFNPPASAPIAPRSMRPTATPESSNATKDSDFQTPEKPLSRSEVAAAATRARMEEIMGPRRRQGQASSSKKPNYTSLSRYSNSDEK